MFVRLWLVALGFLVFTCIGNDANAAFVIGYDISGDMSSPTMPLGTASSRTNLLENGVSFTHGATVNLPVTGFAGDGTTYLEFGFTESGGLWDLDSFDIAFQSGANSETISVLASSNKNPSFTSIGTGLIRNTGHNLVLTGNTDFQGINEATFRIFADFAGDIDLLGGNTFLPVAGSDANLSVQGTFTAVPEPTAVGLLSTLGALSLFRRRRS